MSSARPLNPLRHLNRLLAATVLGALGATACVTDDVTTESDDLTSKDAVFLELSFAGEVVAQRAETDAERKKAIVTQLFYLSGELDKSHRGHGQFGFVELADVNVEALDDGLERVTYNAKLPVAWPKHRAVPETYRVVAPLRTDPAGLNAFNSAYRDKCGEAHYGTDALWYDFTPISSHNCEIAEGDALDVVATVAVHPRTTTDKRPEHERFWDDGVFRMVLVHGTDSASSYDTNDIGVRQYDGFKRKLLAAHPDGVETAGESGGGIYDDWQFEATVEAPGGGEGKLLVNALLAASLQHVGQRFDARFGPLSKEADFISYGGHSGLSKNIKALAAKEQVKEQHYQVWFIDGCSTFAYLDRTLVDARIALNGTDLDPNGTKFLDVIVNAQPAPWYTGTASQWTVLSALADTKPHSYMSIVDELGSSATPVVSGEEDNPSIDE